MPFSPMYCTCLLCGQESDMKNEIPHVRDLITHNPHSGIIFAVVNNNCKNSFMQKISPFLWFDNNAEEAMNFYLSIFKSSKKIMVARNPPGAPGPEGAFLVATIQLEGQEIILMDGGPGHPLTDAISLTVNCESQEEVDYYWS